MPSLKVIAWLEGVKDILVQQAARGEVLALVGEQEKLQVEQVNFGWRFFTATCSPALAAFLVLLVLVTSLDTLVTLAGGGYSAASSSSSSSISANADLAAPPSLQSYRKIQRAFEQAF